MIGKSVEKRRVAAPHHTCATLSSQTAALSPPAA